MSTYSDIISLFNTARDSYASIVGTLTDDDMVRLREAILTILYSISLGANAGCLSGLILTNAAYNRLLGTTVSFNPMIGTFKLYGPSIKDDATDGLQNISNENGPPGSPPSRSSDSAKWDASISSSGFSKTLGSGVSKTRTPSTPVLTQWISSNCSPVTFMGLSMPTLLP